MANKQFKFNVTKEDQEKEEARKQRELEAEVQQRNSIRNKKLEQLNKKQKQNKYIVIISIVVIALSLIIFGTYNTFFKQPLTVDDVNTLIRRSDAKFNDGGLEGFIYNNVGEVFKNNSSLDGLNKNIESYELDLNSLRIGKVTAVTSSIASVDFYINVHSKDKDYTETNPYGDKELKSGSEYDIPYRFTALIGNSGGNYYFASNVQLVGYLSAENDVITQSDLLAFTDIKQVDENISNSAKTKVDRILADLYQHKDPGGDYDPKAKTFDSNLEYKGINEFLMFQSDNKLGFNVAMTYTVTSKSGFTYITKTYLKVEPSGNSWKISKIL